jgi:hypothetical protein
MKNLLSKMMNDPDMPPSLEMPKPKKAKKSLVEVPLHMRGTVVNKLLCKVLGHKVNEGVYIDSHDNYDSLSYCERCGEYDV